MQRSLRVGKGLLKKDVDTAVEVAQPGDTLIFDPGEYIIPVLPVNVNLKGASGNPEDVKIKTTSILENNDICLNGITIEKKDKDIFALFLKNCTVKINNCNISSLKATGSDVSITNSLAKSSEVSKYWFNENSKVQIENLNMQGRILLDGIQDFDLRNIKVENLGETSALTISNSKGTIKKAGISNCAFAAVNVANSNLDIEDIKINQIDVQHFAVFSKNSIVKINNCDIHSLKSVGSDVLIANSSAANNCSFVGNSKVQIENFNTRKILFDSIQDFIVKNVKIKNAQKSNALIIKNSKGTIGKADIENDKVFTAIAIDNSNVNVEDLKTKEDLYILKNSNVTINTLKAIVSGKNDITLADSSLQVNKVLNENVRVRVSGNGKLEINSAPSGLQVLAVKYNKFLFALPSDVEPQEVEPKGNDVVHMSALDKLDNLIGLSSVKEEVRKFIKTANFNKKRQKQGKKAVELGLHSLFLGNPGTGKTTVARLLGKIVYEEGILPENKFVEADAGDLIANYTGQTATKTKKQLDKALGGVFFLDEAYSLKSRGSFGQEALDTILKFMEDNRNNIMVIFAGYDDEMTDLLDMNSGLSSRFSNEFHFEDYTTEEITKLGLMQLKNEEFKVDQDAYSLGIKRAYNPKRCSNGRWIREINGKLERMAISNTEDEEDPVIDENVINEVLDLNVQGREDSENALEELNNIIGLDKVKEEVQKFIEMSRMNQQRIEHGYGASDLQLHSLFLGNPGTGKTTVARLLGKIMYAEGILSKDSFVEVDAGDLVANYVGQTATKTKKQLDKALGGVFFLDEAYSLKSRGSFGQEALDTILKFMEDNRDDIMVIFAGYNKEMQDLLEMNSGLQSRFPNEFHFEDYTADEIVQIGLKMLDSKGGIKVDKDAYSNAVKQTYNPEICDNARWIRNRNGDLLKEAEHRQFTSSDGNNDGTIEILEQDINKAFNIERTENKSDATSSEISALDEINNLIGLNSVKKQIKGFINIAKVNKIRQEQGLPRLNRTLHSLFLGNPGTGKTTVAELLGKALYQEGVISKNKCLNVKREDLVSQYVGKTAIKTKKVLERSLGGVLFVDEAYTLASGGSNDFGKEALDTILAFMEDHRDDIIVIFAGYNREMEQVLEMNSGLKSRFPNVFQFEDYTPEEIATIGTKMLEKQQYKFNHELYKEVVMNKYSEVQNRPEYLNARGVRNLNQKLIDIQESNLFANGDIDVAENITIISDDDLLQFKDMEL